MRHEPVRTGAVARPSGRAQHSIIIIIIKPGQFITLPVEHIVDCLFNVSLLPKIWRAAMPRPWACSSGYQASFAKLSCRVGFEGVHHWFWFASNGNDGVNMIRANAYRLQKIPAIETDVSDRILNYRSLPDVESDRSMF